MSSGDPWDIEEIEPTNIIVIWPDPAAPTFVEAGSLLAGVIGRPVEPIDEIEAEDPEIQWSTVVRLGVRETPVILWAEPFRPDSVSDDPIEIGDAQWVIGFETLLDTEDPVTDYASIMRAIAAAFDDAPAVLDVNTTRWLTRAELDELFVETDIDPPSELLWIIHAVSSEEGEEEGGVWLHTHGLWRCGLPELEILDVPESHSAEGGHLINAVADLALEVGLPEAGEVFAPGPEIEAVLQPWREAARFMPDEMPGSEGDRERQEPEFATVHLGVRAAICDPEQRGEFKKVWTWPHQALEAMKRDDAVLFRSRRATERQALLAQSTWPEFAMAFATLRSADQLDLNTGGAVFLIKAGFGEDEADGSGQDEESEEREHLWFEVGDVRGDRAEGTLLNDPGFAQHLTKGDRVWIDRDRVSDWNVFTPGGAIEAGQIAQLRAAVTAIRDERP